MSSWGHSAALGLFTAPPFGWWIAGYFALAAFAAGLVLSAALPCLLGAGPERQVKLKKACLWALGAITLGGACLVGDLASPKDFLLTLTHFNPDSWISIGSRILGLFGVLCFVTLAFIPSAESTQEKPNRILPALLALAALALAVYPAMVLIRSTGRPLWDSLWLPALFLASACHIGASLGPSLLDRKAIGPCQNTTALIELALFAGFAASKRELLFSGNAWMLWAAAYLACAFILPHFLASRSTGARPGSSAWLVVIGTFALRMWLLEAGQSSVAFLS